MRAVACALTYRLYINNTCSSLITNSPGYKHARVTLTALSTIISTASGVQATHQGPLFFIHYLKKIIFFLLCDQNIELNILQSYKCNMKHLKVSGAAGWMRIAHDALLNPALVSIKITSTSQRTAGVMSVCEQKTPPQKTKQKTSHLRNESNSQPVAIYKPQVCK